jgi:serine/threonine protein kinase
LSATAARLEPGQLLDGGSYRVVRPLGKGGMGAVWLVAQTKAFDRLAVVKEVIDYFDPTDAGARQKADQRFEAEARTLGDLKHPGIPDLYAFFSERGHNYLVMEYIEGPDLRKGLTREDSTTGQLIAGGPTPAEQVLGYTVEICRVLQYLAGRQPPVVHNDIKPGNIIIDQHSGRAVLVDFGTAKTRYLHGAGQPDGSQDSLYGTVGYAAPELYRGQSEPRSDVYSLAATAYHLLTDDDPRDHPFQYPQLAALPTALAGILRAALAEEIDKRLTANQFRQQLDGYLAGQNAPLRALTFPDGDAAESRSSLLALSVRHWRYATSLLQDGTMGRWLQGTLHDPAAARAAQSAVQQWPHNPDGALDAFIRQLDPTAQPPGVLQLRTTSLRLPQVGAGLKISQQIEIANRGRGYLRGEILSSQPWLAVGSGRFGCPPSQAVRLPLEINTTGLTPEHRYVAAVTLLPAGGDPEVLPVEVTVITPVIRVRPSRVDFGSVSYRSVSTPRRSVTVTNAGQVEARCQVQGKPAWLQVKPEHFQLQPAAEQSVELVGLTAKIQGRKHRVTVTIALEGGQDQQVEIRLRLKSGFFD